MNLTYIIGLVVSLAVMIVGMMFGTGSDGKMTLLPPQIITFS